MKTLFSFRWMCTRQIHGTNQCQGKYETWSYLRRLKEPWAKCNTTLTLTTIQWKEVLKLGTMITMVWLETTQQAVQKVCHYFRIYIIYCQRFIIINSIWSSAVVSPVCQALGITSFPLLLGIAFAIIAVFVSLWHCSCHHCGVSIISLSIAMHMYWCPLLTILRIVKLNEINPGVNPLVLPDQEDFLEN